VGASKFRRESEQFVGVFEIRILRNVLMGKWLHQLGSFMVLGAQHPEILVQLNYIDIVERDVLCQ
jgi:hypothetical protein